MPLNACPLPVPVEDIRCNDISLTFWYNQFPLFFEGYNKMNTFSFQQQQYNTNFNYSWFSSFGVTTINPDITLSECFLYLYNVYNSFGHIFRKTSAVSREYINTHFISICMNSSLDIVYEQRIKHNTVTVHIKDKRGVSCYIIVFDYVLNLTHSVEVQNFILCDLKRNIVKSTSSLGTVYAFISTLTDL